MSAYMLDTNVFNRLADGEVSFDAFRSLRLAATHVQLDELRATKNSARAADLLRAFEEVDPTMDRTASAFLDVSNWDQSSWSPEEVEKQMLDRLTHLDVAKGKKHRDPKNRIRDVLIGHTAIKNKATLISDDPRLRQLVSEFDGRAVSTSDIKRMTRVRWKVGLFRAWIVGSICWVAYSVWDRWPTEKSDLACWRRLLGVEEGGLCGIDWAEVPESAFWIFGRPLLAGIALLAVAWIATGFQRRA